MHLATRLPRFLLISTLAISAVLVPARSFAAAKDASIAFFLQEANGTLACRDISLISCSDKNAIVSGKLLTDYFAIACVFNGVSSDVDPEEYGIAGAQFGIDYDGGSQSGVDIQSWTMCSDGLEFPSDGWPGPKSANIVTWNFQEGCQNTVPGAAEDGVTAIIGYFYLTAYSADRLSVIPDFTRQESPIFAISSCQSITTDLDPNKQAGSLGFSSDLTEQGNIPCLHHTTNKTWGQIKSTYGH